MKRIKTIIELDIVIDELGKKQLVKLISRMPYISDYNIVVYDEEEYTEQSSFAIEAYQRIRDELIDDIASNSD